MGSTYVSYYVNVEPLKKLLGKDQETDYLFKALLGYSEHYPLKDRYKSITAIQKEKYLDNGKIVIFSDTHPVNPVTHIKYPVGLWTDKRKFSPVYEFDRDYDSLILTAQKVIKMMNLSNTREYINEPPVFYIDDMLAEDFLAFLKTLRLESG